MKLTRWIYGIVTAISLFMGMYTGLRVYYVVFFTLFFTVLAALALSRWTVFAFKYTQTLTAGICEKGAELILHLKIINECPIPLSLIEAHIKVVSLQKVINLVFNLAPYTGQNFEIPITTPYRGNYQIGMTVLKITDIFGLTVLPMDMRRLAYYRMAELLVLPRAQAPGNVSADMMDSKRFGDIKIKPADQGDSVAGARLYRAGDALKRIHWKKSAQQNSLFVKQYEYPEQEHITILIDTSPHGLSGESVLIYADTVCECAACIALNSLSHGRAVHIKNTGSPSAQMTCHSLSQYNLLRRYLAMLLFEEQADLSVFVRQSSLHVYQMRSLFIITQSESFTVPAHAPSSSFTTTYVLVGEKKPNKSPHTIFVEQGSAAAEHLSGVH